LWRGGLWEEVPGNTEKAVALERHRWEEKYYRSITGADFTSRRVDRREKLLWISILKKRPEKKMTKIGGIEGMGSSFPWAM